MNYELLEKLKQLNGKSITNSKLLSQLKAYKNYDKFKEILLANDKHDAEGTKKTCTYIDGLAVLKSFESYAPTSQHAYNAMANTIVSENKKLREKGALIPEVYSLFFADKKYLEVQQKINGNIVSILSLEGFINNILNKIEFSNPVQFREQISEQIFKYNVSQQELMKKLPQKCFDDLFNTYQILNDNFYGDYDSHCENVLVSEKGFTLVDIDYSTMLFNNVKLSNKQVFTKFLRPFMNTTAFQSYLTSSQIECLLLNNVEIFKKLVCAASKKGVDLTEEAHYLDEIGRKFVGNKNWAEYQISILSYQNEIIKNKIVRK